MQSRLILRNHVIFSMAPKLLPKVYPDTVTDVRPRAGGTDGHMIISTILKQTRR